MMKNALIAVLLALLFVQGRGWPLDPVAHPPSVREADEGYRSIEGWDGGEFRAAQTAWEALRKRIPGPRSPYRDVTDYRILVYDRGEFYHVHLLTKPKSSGTGTMGGSTLVIVYKRPFAAKYILGGG